MERFLLWTGLEDWLHEAATAELSADGVTASGTQLGADPVPYRLDYRLDAAEGFVTASLEVDAVGDGWRRHLALIRDRTGRWRCDTRHEGAADLPPPGGDMATLDEALDCDLGLSPLTNLMPVRRLGLHERPGAYDFLMAWVSVPDLGVRAEPQRYEHVRRDGDGAVVRFSIPSGFTSDLFLDADGLVLRYPALARRVSATTTGP